MKKANPLDRFITWGIVLVLCVGCGTPHSPRYVSPDGTFAVTFPGSPSVRHEVSRIGPVRKIHLDRSEVAFEVAVVDLDLPPDTSPEEIQQRLEGIRNAIIKERNGQVLREEDYLFSGQTQGLDLFARLPGRRGYLRDRICISQGKLFQVMVKGKKKKVEGDEAQTFLDSFQLLTD